MKIICDNPDCENSNDGYCKLQNVKLEGIGTDDEFCDGFKQMNRKEIENRQTIEDDYPKTEIITKDELHKMAVAHWDYVKAVIINSESNINHKLLDIIGFHYIPAFKHGYKHGKGDLK